MRSRGSFSRPFTKVEELRAEAEARYLQTEQRLQQELAETERRLGELQSSREDTGSLLLTDAQQAEMRAALKTPEYGWGHAKQSLYEALEAELGGAREKYEALRADEAGLDALLEKGAARVRPIAQATMRRVREAIGMRV